MPELIRFKLSDDTEMLVEAGPGSLDGRHQVSGGRRLEDAEATLRQALSPVTRAAEDIVDGFRRLARRPDEIEISFGVKLDAKVGGVVASSSMNAHLDVKLSWRSSSAERKAVRRAAPAEDGEPGADAPESEPDVSGSEDGGSAGAGAVAPTPEA